MARLTREESVARTRTKLLDAAAEVFAEKGFGGAALDDIAERAGYTRGALYANFADKEDLFLCVFDRVREASRGEVQAELAAIESPQQGLGVFTRIFRERAPQTRRLYLLMNEARQFALRNKTMQRRLAEHEQESRALIESVIVTMFGTEPVSPSLLALMVQALDNGFWSLHFVDPKRVTLDDYLDAVGLLFRAVAAVQADRETSR